MPRTKISKTAKRNRDAANRENKVCLYEIKMDSAMTKIDDLEQECVRKVESVMDMIVYNLQTELREMKMCDFLEILEELPRFSDFKASDQTTHLVSQSMCNASNLTGDLGPEPLILGGGSNRNDEGYLTEDSSQASCSGGGTLAAFTGSALRHTRAMRTPGPLNSARARRARRSRSACGDMNLLPMPSAKVMSASSNSSAMGGSEHSSRSKMRTPMASRPKAISADRTPLMQQKAGKSPPSTPPMAFLRWPKPGEVAHSKFGSPIVTQVMPDKVANVNIPIRNGVLSLRPKKLNEVQDDLLESLDAETLHQIRTLNENLQLIVNTANKAGLK